MANTLPFFERKLYVGHQRTKKSAHILEESIQLRNFFRRKKIWAREKNIIRNVFLREQAIPLAKEWNGMKNFPVKARAMKQIM